MYKYNATLKLSDGSTFKGFGAGFMQNTGEKEIVFHTNNVGIVQVVTDPCNAGQIIVQTFPMIGDIINAHSEVESDDYVASGYILKTLNHFTKNQCKVEFDEFLKSKGIPCITGIDTRALTNKIRESTVKITGKIIFDNPTTFALARNLMGKLSQFTIGEGPINVALVNLGMKNSTKNILLKYATLNVFNADVDYNKIMAVKPQAIVISEGPGTPSSQKLAINLVKANLATKVPVPMLGLGLGANILALGHGFKVVRLPVGHHGNQAIRKISTGKIYQVASNSNMTVSQKSITHAAKISYQNICDNSIVGLNYKKSKSMGFDFFAQNQADSDCLSFIWDEFFGGIN
ncbi:MAG: hypothetical protein LBU60_00470 [Clostridiales bacterium]|nr:hypothetical protein [Clostridiales bacterium]